MLLPSLLLIIFFNISPSHSSNISINYLGILSHKVDLDPSKILFITLRNDFKEIKIKPDNYRNGFLNSILDYNELFNCNSIFKLTYYTSNNYRTFYLTLLNENDFYFEFGLNSIPVLKFFIGNLIKKCKLKKNYDDKEFDNLPLRGFKSFGILVSYYYGFLLEMKEDLRRKDFEGKYLEGNPNNTPVDHNTPNNYPTISYFCDKFLNFYLHFRNLKHLYSTPDSLLRDYYVDALYCAIDFYNLSKNNNEDDLDFINHYNFEEEDSIFVNKYLLIKIKEGHCDSYEFLDENFKKINENENCEKREILEYEDLEREPLPKSPLNKLQNDNLNNILLLKKDINQLGIKYLKIKSKGKEIRINLNA
ncbi:hypothetical protein NBO_508g0030 [Nosema bombycis CQ1]|uniref:Uncharacterized protein n=1 Tax=Nosema bombycis (strain CQ1 / CVCC 102059) TaxID=578461 RepID=R0M2B8_NOSB1|nr:hypothetical protein NBO_508g0030 [Nosema bombycis CQ1]|eukprot:EOB12179.1 hypothetical protein NBO_508g0030 [Nosema bombycis CQ1]